jgi:ankyrin repeat protein
MVIFKMNYFNSLFKYGDDNIISFLKENRISKKTLQELLFYSCRKGHVKLVEYILSTNINLERVSNKNYNALHFAIKNNHCDIVRILLNKNINLETTAKNDLDILQYCAIYGNPEIFRLVFIKVLDNKISSLNNNQCMYFKNAFIKYINQNKYSLTELLKKEHLINIYDSKIIKPLYSLVDNLIFQGENNPLTIACKYGNFDLVNLILQYYKMNKISNKRCIISALSEVQKYHRDRFDIFELFLNFNDIFNFDINYNENINYSSATKFYFSQSIYNIDYVYSALYNGSVKFIELCINKGLLENFEFGIQHLYACFEKENNNCIKLLMQFCGDYTINFGQGYQFIHFACLYGNMEIFNLLSKNSSVDLNAPIINNDRPIHIACEKGFIDIVKILLDRGINYNQINNNNNTPFSIACNKGNLEIAKLLIDYGANIELGENIIDTFINVCYNGYVKTAKWMFYKFKLRKIDWKKSNPLHKNSKEGNLEMIDFLLKKFPKINIMDNIGMKPIFYAIQHNKIDAVKILDDGFVSDKLYRIPMITDIRSMKINMKKLKNKKDIYNYIVGKLELYNRTIFIKKTDYFFDIDLIMLK